jgi:hypothetical protein
LTEAFKTPTPGTTAIGESRWLFELMGHVRPAYIGRASDKGQNTMAVDYSQPDTEMVRSIIEEELRASEKVHKSYVWSLIEQRANKSRLCSKTAACRRNSDRPSQNLSVGAKLIFKDSFRHFKEHYVIDDQGWIRRRVGDESTRNGN